MSIRYLSITKLSELTGKDRRTITKRLESLTPHKEDGRALIYDAQQALELIYTFETTVGIDKKLKEEQLRYERGRADKIQLEVEKRRGQLVEVESVALAIEKEYAAVRSGLMAIPSKMAHVLSVVDDPNEIKEKLEDAINETLGELSTKHNYELESPSDSEEKNEELDRPTISEPTESSQAEAEVKPS